MEEVVQNGKIGTNIIYGYPLSKMLLKIYDPAFKIWLKLNLELEAV